MGHIGPPKLLSIVTYGHKFVDIRKCPPLIHLRSASTAVPRRMLEGAHPGVVVLAIVHRPPTVYERDGDPEIRRIKTSYTNNS